MLEGRRLQHVSIRLLQASRDRFESQTACRRNETDLHPLPAPLRVVLRFPEFAAGVRRITTCLWRQRMKEQAAFQRFCRCNQLGDNLEVLARLLLGPSRISFW